MANKRIWNELAEEYSGIDLLTDWRLGYPYVERLIGDIKGKSILDYGCGSGQFTRRLHDIGAIVTAVDASESAIDIARRKDNRNIQYRVIKNNDVSFLKNNSLDGAVSTFVLCTIKRNSQIQHMVKQIYDKLRPKSYFIILEPHPNSLGYEYVSMRREKPEKIETGTHIKVHLNGMDSPFYDYWRSIEDYKEILEHSGFNIDKIKEPVIKGRPDETFWKDERIQSPHLIIRARKS